MAPNSQPPIRLNRRDWLQAVSIPTLAAIAATACGEGTKSYFVDRTAGAGRRRRFVPVAATRDRIIRSSVGLRPYRSAGFRLEAEKLEGKQLVHLYGHGGGGMTLSWGCANLAIGLLGGQGRPRGVAVIGGGVVGLSTALLLQRQDFEVTIYTATLPPHTTSNASAATFYPSHVVGPTKATPQFGGQLELALRTSYHACQRLVGPRYGIRWVDSYRLSDGAPSSEPVELETRLFDKVVGRTDRVLSRREHPFAAARVTQGRDLVIEPPMYLRALLEDYRQAGGKVTVRRFETLRDVARLSEATVFNCTGLGARTLVGDTDLRPAAGQLCVLPPQPDVDYTLSHGDFFYMVPRQDGVILGGTFDLGVESTGPDPATETRLVQAHARVFDAMK